MQPLAGFRHADTGLDHSSSVVRVGAQVHDDRGRGRDFDDHHDDDDEICQGRTQLQSAMTMAL